MLVKIEIVDQIQVLEMGQIQVRTASKITEDNIEISKSYHRNALSPGDDLVGQDARVIAIAQTVWTPEVITAYKASIATQ